MRHLRILVVIGAVFVVVAAVTVALGAGRQPEPETQPLPPTVPTTSSTPASPDTPDAPTPTPGPSSSTPYAGEPGEVENHEDGPAETQEALWGPVADHFARHFTDTSGGPRKWRQRLIGNPQQPYVTDEVARQLGTVDVRNVPDGHYESREIAQSGEYEIAVKVDYREGWSMVLYLVSDGTRWQIHTYDKWVE